MTESRIYQPTTVEQNLRRWLVLATQAIPGDVQVLYANQGAVRVPRPFVTLQVISDVQTQDPTQVVRDVQLPDGTYQLDTIEFRQGTVQVMAVGNTSWLVMRAVSRSLRRREVIDQNRLNGVEILQEITGITDVPELLSTETEPRRMQDYQFAYCETTSETTGADVVESVVGTAEIFRNVPGDGIEVVVDESWPTT